ncbi:hypothetical protein BJV78DRAFT_1244337 [Lactifluus subvellereus]|nr:hypothetical protein BJV78DRAFT_1244337 [Lactifluus subvellereus]
MTMTGISIVALMMFLRILQAIVLAILLTFIGVNSWLLTRGIPVQHQGPENLQRDHRPKSRWSDRLLNRLASSPVWHRCGFSHYQTHGKLFSLQ